MADFSVLVIDDSPTIRKKLMLTLHQAKLSDEIHEAESGEQAMACLEQKVPDLIICDVMMPGMDGMAVLAALKQDARFQAIPVIMLTGEDAVGKKLEAFEHGASDYVTKPFDTRELLARCNVQKQLKLLQDELRKASITDFLTGLFNRRHFMGLLETEFERAHRYRTELSLLMLDVDHFKQINDNFGHPIGDHVLVELSQTLHEAMRGSDAVARVGGEEFAILMPHTPGEAAETTGERVRLSVKAHLFPKYDGEVTVSLGLASYPAAGISSAEDLIREADHALYRAKDRGRDRLCIAAFE